MRRERKREQKEQRYIVREERLRQRRQRKSDSPAAACQPSGGESGSRGRVMPAPAGFFSGK
jgi:hypothetical protein